MMGALAGVRKVLIVNLSVPPSVKDPVAVPNNAALADRGRRHPNAMLVDWRAASANHPEFFAEDSIHLTLEGAQAYAELIAANFTEDRRRGLGGTTWPPRKDLLG